MRRCSFCLRSESEENPLIEGAKAEICYECADTIMEEFEDLIVIDSTSEEEIKKPHEIKQELDKYVIGQDEAKKILSVAVYNHYKRINRKTRTEIQKTNILMIGPSGSGKTYIVQQLAKILNVPLVIVDATSLTEAGYIGEDVESILEKLIIKANGDIKKAEKGIVFIDEIDKISTDQRSGDIRTREAGGRGVQEALLKIIEDSEVSVPVGGSSFFSPKSVTVQTKDILFICGGAFVGLDKIIQKRKNKDKSKIGFVNSFNNHSSNNSLISTYDVSHEDLIEYGLIPEFVGRTPLITVLNPLTEEDLFKILTEPRNAILKQYQSLLRMDGVRVKFNKDAIRYIVEEAMKKNIGARGLKSVIERQMYELMYELPQNQDIRHLTITKEMLMRNKSFQQNRANEV